MEEIRPQVVHDLRLVFPAEQDRKVGKGQIGFLRQMFDQLTVDRVVLVEERKTSKKRRENLSLNLFPSICVPVKNFAQLGHLKLFQ